MYARMAGNKVYVQGSYVDIHDNEVVNLSIDKVGTVNLGDEVTKVEEVAEESKRDVPAVLSTSRAQAMMAKAVEAGWLDEEWQPLVSLPEAALLAMKVSESLDIKYVWKVFGELWHHKRETLRAKYNVAMNQEKSLKLQDKLNKVLK